jgi:hypothetical protein
MMHHAAGNGAAEIVPAALSIAWAIRGAFNRLQASNRNRNEPANSKNTGFRCVRAGEVSRIARGLVGSAFPLPGCAPDGSEEGFDVMKPADGNCYHRDGSNS